MKTSFQISSAVCLLLGLAFAPLASADDVSVEVETAAVAVPIGGADVEFISKTIDVTGPRTLVIHYFAECQVPRGHIEYDIVVNQFPLNVTSRQVPPTHDVLSALCSNDGDTTESNLRAKSVGTVVACTITSAADYTVRVRGHVEGPGAVGPGMVDDQSLVIEERGFSAGLPSCITALPGGVQ